MNMRVFRVLLTCELGDQNKKVGFILFTKRIKPNTSCSWVVGLYISKSGRKK